MQTSTFTTTKILGDNSDSSSGESCDESGSEPASPANELQQRNHLVNQPCKEENSDTDNESDLAREPTPSSSNEDMKPINLQSVNPNFNLQNPLPFHPSILSNLANVGNMGNLANLANVGNLEGLGNNLGLGNLGMGYTHGFLVGLPPGQSPDGASSSQPQYITIPFSVAMAAAGQQAANPDSGLQDLSSKSSRK